MASIVLESFRREPWKYRCRWFCRTGTDPVSFMSVCLSSCLIIFSFVPNQGRTDSSFEKMVDNSKTTTTATTLGKPQSYVHHLTVGNKHFRDPDIVTYLASMAPIARRHIGLSLLVLLGAAVVDPIQEVVAFSANVAKAPSSSVTSGATSKTSSFVYDGLSTTPLVRASDSSSVLLPSLWRSDTPFGIGDEIAVCAFLRHYG